MNAKHLKGYDLAAAQAHFAARVRFTTGAHELEQLVDQASKGADLGDFKVVDVRYPADFAQGRVPGAVNLPSNKWTAAGAEKAGLSKDGINYLYCYNPTCHLAANAAVDLIRLGYRVVEVEGGWSTWVANGYRIEVVATSAAA
jgi:rhodanese-related sulfurtransferase